MINKTRVALIILSCLVVIGFFLAFRGNVFTQSPPIEVGTSPLTSSVPTTNTLAQGNDAPGKTKDVEKGSAALANALIKLLTPPSATASDWQQAKIAARSLKDANIPFWTLVKMRPIMEADTNTTSFHTRASNQRGPSGEIVTTVWSNKILNTLEIDWSKGSVTKRPQNRANGTMFEERHSEQRGLNNRDFWFANMPPQRVDPCILLSIRGKNDEQSSFFIPFIHPPYLTLAAFVPSSYPIGAMPELAKTRGNPSYILLVDTDRREIVGEVPLPADLSGRPTFILDKENDVLLATQFQLDWLIAIDLRSYIKKIQKGNP